MCAWTTVTRVFVRGPQSLGYVWWTVVTRVCVQWLKSLGYVCVDCSHSGMCAWTAVTRACVRRMQSLVYVCVECSHSCMCAQNAVTRVCVRGMQVSWSMNCVHGKRCHRQFNTWRWRIQCLIWMKKVSVKSKPDQVQLINNEASGKRAQTQLVR